MKLLLASVKLLASAINLQCPCPICGVRLSPNGHRMMKCLKCELEQDRDIIAVRNLLRKHLAQIDVPSSSVQGESPPIYEEGGDEG